MKKIPLLAAPALLGLAALSACATTDAAAETTEAAAEDESTVAPTVSESSSDLVPWLDVETVAEGYTADTTVTLADGATTADGDGVSVSGDVVTITDAGTYVLTGELTDGYVVVDTQADGEVRIVLDGASISSSTSSAIVVADADEPVIYLADGSDNYLADGAADNTVLGSDDIPNATIYSKQDLVVAGAGSLTIDAVNDGITSKDSLLIQSGVYDITAGDDGIRGKDSLVILDGDIAIDAAGDGLTSDNEDAATDETLLVGIIDVRGGTLSIGADVDGMDAENAAIVRGGSVTIEAGDDGIHGELVTAVEGGTVDIVQSYEGLEAAVVVVTGGQTSIVASDDGINGSDGSGAGGEMGGGGMAGGQAGGPGGGMDTAADGVEILISGGTLVVDSAGDGLDSNGTMTISGGTVVVHGPVTDREGALDTNGTFEVDGGTLIAVGAAGMAEAPDSSSDQAYIGVAFGTTLPAGTVVSVADSSGTVIAALETVKEAASLVFSSDAVTSGDEYTISTGGSISGDTLGGLTLAASAVSGGTSLGSVSAS